MLCTAMLHVAINASRFVAMHWNARIDSDPINPCVALCCVHASHHQKSGEVCNVLANCELDMTQRNALCLYCELSFSLRLERGDRDCT